VAKRTQASRSAHRPGGQGPNRAKKTPEADESAAIPSEADVTSAEEIGATYSEVEVDEVAAAAVAAVGTQQATEEPASGRRSRRRAQTRTSKRRSGADLTSRSAAEDVWVRADLRRIGVVSAILIVGLALAYLVFGVMDVLGLY
jgi:hypothetical protein